MQVYVDEVVYSISEISRGWQIEVGQNNFVITVQYMELSNHIANALNLNLCMMTISYVS